MNKPLALILLGVALTSIASAQSAAFNFNSAPVATQDVFSSNGFSLTVNGLASTSSLNQNSSTVSLNATGTNILVGPEHGIGAGPFSDHELRNGGGTPGLSGATVLELSDLDTPTNTMATSFHLNMTSVDKSTHEGFLVYGSNQDASKGLATLTLLDHSLSNSGNNGSFDINQSMLGKYSTFYVTADNGHYSSVLLGSGTSVCAAPTPEPITMAGLGIACLGLLRRRKQA